MAADIAVEAVLDSIGHPAVKRLPYALRESWYERLEAEIGCLTAEKIYRYLEEQPLTEEEYSRLEKEFCRCDHSFWQREPEKRRGAGLPPPETDWEQRGKQMETALLLLGKKPGEGGGQLLRLLRFQYEERPLYRDFLRRCMVFREHVGCDPDSFDYGYYHFGLHHYGNMPLVEAYELREERRVEALVLVIDTSASCDPALIQDFLRDTAAILGEDALFFRHAELRLLQCDDQVRADLSFEGVEGLRRYGEQLAVHGGGGTDFRAAFRYVEQLQERGELSALRGLLYFTDGFGPYPEKAPPYETGFVFQRARPYEEDGVPPWALKLYMD